MTNKLKISLWHDELQYLCFGLNDEIKNLVHKEIWLYYANNCIELTQNAYEKMMYYLKDPLLKKEIEFQIKNQQ